MVTVWNLAGVSTVSQPARFTTGLFDQNDWDDAEWIDAGYCSESADLTTTGTCSGGLLRTEFSVTEDPVLDRASLFVSACQCVSALQWLSEIGHSHVFLP